MIISAGSKLCAGATVYALLRAGFVIYVSFWTQHRSYLLLSRRQIFSWDSWWQGNTDSVLRLTLTAPSLQRLGQTRLPLCQTRTEKWINDLWTPHFFWAMMFGATHLSECAPWWTLINSKLKANKLKCALLCRSVVFVVPPAVKRHVFCRNSCSLFSSFFVLLSRRGARLFDMH